MRRDASAVAGGILAEADVITLSIFVARLDIFVQDATQHTIDRLSISALVQESNVYQ